MIVDKLKPNSYIIYKTFANGRVALTVSPGRSLSTYESINRLKASLHRFVHGFSGDNSWGLQLNSLTLVRDDWTQSIDGFTEWVQNATEQTFTDGYIDDGTGPLHNVAFLDFSVTRK
jgi:hypothetical protein